MKQAYPIIISQKKKGMHYVSIPDFGSATQGKDIADAMEMARDAIGLLGIDLEDEGKDMPKPYSHEWKSGPEDIVTLVDVDFADYRCRVDNRAVRKNCTIPYWMDVEAEKAGINFSRLLQDAIMKALKLKPRY